MSARETELEEYNPRDLALLPKIPSLILQHAQIRWSNWLAAQWGKTSEVPFPDLVGIWTAMENQDPWEPTLPASYTFTYEATYRTSISTRLTPGQTHPVRWHTSETSAAPTVAAAAATVSPTLKAEWARRISGSGGGGTWAVEVVA